jgi:hypothetical protein
MVVRGGPGSIVAATEVGKNVKMGNTESIFFEFVLFTVLVLV